MVFSSLTFLFGYLPIVLVLYFIVPLKWRNLVLFLVSLFFYGWGEPVYILIMLLSIAVAYICGIQIEKYRSEIRRARRFLIGAVIFNLLLLGFFKYWDFFARNLSLIPGIHIPELGLRLPIGISFFTFQIMSYLIDVYRQDAPVQKNPIAFGTFVTMFPQLIAGPIVKYKTVAEELDRRVNTSSDFAAGARRFCIGLAKKVLLANSIGALWDSSMAAMKAGNLTVAGGWMGLVAFSFQIYFDFSGYSDMAIGMGWMLGFHFEENFMYPYMAASVSEFWRRWHISLTSWFHQYLYFPLGGSRHGKGKTLRNILIVWFCTGFWHGANWNFILWGLYFAGWLILEKYVFRDVLTKTPAVIKHLYTLFVVVVGWGIFKIENFHQCGAYLKVCFGGGPLWSASTGYNLRSYAMILVVLAVASTTAGVNLWKKLPTKVQKIVTPILMLAALLLCTAYLVDGSYNPFLYFRF